MKGFFVRRIKRDLLSEISRRNREINCLLSQKNQERFLGEIGKSIIKRDYYKMSIIIGKLQINATDIVKTEEKYLQLFLEVTVYAFSGKTEIIIKYDRSNKRYVLLVRRKEILVLETDEALISYLRFKFEDILEVYTTHIRISLNAMNDAMGEKYTWIANTIKNFSLVPYHEFDRREFNSLNREEQGFFPVPKQAEAIPKVIKMIEPLCSVIKGGFSKNRLEEQDEIEVAAFIRTEKSE